MFYFEFDTFVEYQCELQNGNASDALQNLRNVRNASQAAIKSNVNDYLGVYPCLH